MRKPRLLAEVAVSVAACVVYWRVRAPPCVAATIAYMMAVMGWMVSLWEATWTLWQMMSQAIRPRQTWTNSVIAP